MALRSDHPAMFAPAPIPLQQSDRYAATLRLMGREVRMIPVPDGPPVLAVTRRLGPVPVTYMPRADLSGPRRVALDRLPSRAARLIVPEGQMRMRGAFPILTPQHIAEINVPSAPVHATLWANMHGKWRNRLRRALDGPLMVRRSDLSPARHAPLLAREAEQRKRRGYQSYGPDFLTAWTRANPHHAPLFEARLDGETVAYMLFLTHGVVATYVVGWTGPAGRGSHAHTLLMWSAMRDLFSSGITRIDLGAIDTEGGRDLARFKLGCGARGRTLGPTLLVPPGFRVSH